MENAVKALIIAGSVIVAILIISLGVSIYTSNSDVTNEADSTMGSTAAFAFNQKFSHYFSNSASGSAAKDLVDQVFYNNLSIDSSKFSPGDHHIYLNFYPKTGAELTHKWKISDLQNISNQISNGKRYKLYATRCDTYSGGYYNGYLICISIKEL